ncbi:hypothetical protein V8G54_033437 [Vigna mungo]|uniref:Uncharacterized protein n=1 Tax=Vigna mungo TaxID=3915 RepID=A0AAQ3MPT8_VIGMU
MVVNNMYYHVHLGKLQVPLKENEFSFPAMPKLYLEDMPSFFFGEDLIFLDFEVSQFSSIHEADWILCNTFYERHKEVLPQFKTIGPNIPSFFLDKRWEDDQDYGATEFKSEECMEWLDDMPKGSVVYVSFGSVASFRDKKMEEIACCLRDCRRNQAS